MLGMRLRTSLTLAVLAFAVLALAPTLAFAETPDFADDIVSGSASALPGSPFTGYLNETTDSDDVFQLNVTAGQNLFVKMTGAAGTDFDLYLFAPGTRSIAGTMPAAIYSETAKTSSERILYRNVPLTGRYFLDAWAFSGSGAYTITYGFPTVEPTLDATAATTVSWGGTRSVTGSLRTPAAAPIAGETLYLYAKGYRDASFKKIAETTTSALGTYSFAVQPTSVTRYRVRLLGTPTYLPVDANDVTVSPYAYLTRPTAPSTAKVSASFASVGYLKPRHTAGSQPVKLSCYRLEDGVWKVRKTVYATCSDYASYSKYAARYSLPYAGRWKVTASVAGDALHLTTSTSARYITVSR